MTKYIATTALLFGLSLSAAAQGPPGGGPPPGPQQGPPPEAILHEVLGFTPEQLTALHGLLDTRRQAAEALQKQAAEAQKALADAANAANPDPANVGTKFLALLAIQKQGGKIEESFKNAFDGLLTSDQRSKVESIKGLEASLAAGQVLRQLGAM